jgi:hypothetical protein
MPYIVQAYDVDGPISKAVADRKQALEVAVKWAGETRTPDSDTRRWPALHVAGIGHCHHKRGPSRGQPGPLAARASMSKFTARDISTSSDSPDLLLEVRGQSAKSTSQKAPKAPDAPSRRMP